VIAFKSLIIYYVAQAALPCASRFRWPREPAYSGGRSAAAPGGPAGSAPSPSWRRLCGSRRGELCL